MTFHIPLPLSVMLVEDCEPDARLVREALALAPNPPALMDFGTGLDAKAYLGVVARTLFTRPDLILLDLRLPDLDGQELLGWVKAEPELRRIPVVVFTSSESPEDMARCYERHAAGYLVKPFTFSGYVQQLHALLSFWQVVRRPG